MLLAGLSVQAADSELLTVEERDWISARQGRLRYGATPDYPPLEFLEQGKPAGIAGDYIRLVEQKTGLHFEVVKATNWNEVVAMAARREVDVVVMVQRMPERESFWTYTTPYYSVPTVLVTSRRFDGDLTLGSLARLRVGSLEGYAATAYLRKNYPELRFTIVLNEREGLRKVSLGELDVLISDIATTAYISERDAIPNLRIAGYTGHRYEYGMAARNDWPILHRILEKALASISAQERDAIQRRWIHMQAMEPTNWIPVWIVGGALLAMLGAIFIWNHTLRRQVRLRTAQLEEELRCRHAAEEAVRISEAKYRELVENVNSIILRLDGQGRIIFCNEYAQRFFGYAEDELLGRLLLETIVPTVESTGRDLRQLVAGLYAEPTQHVEVENENVTKDGRRVWVRWHNKVVTDAQGCVTGILSVGSDNTARKQAEQLQLRLERDLRQAQKMEALGTLAGGIAHDFNNILASILGNAELAGLDLPKGHPAMECIQAIKIASHRATDLVKQILTFSRQQELARHPLSLLAVTKEALKLIRASLPSSIQMELDLDPQCPMVLANPTQIHQVLMNLGANAAHAMRERGGCLRISLQKTTLDAAQAAELPHLHAGEYVKMTVADTGHGMNRATLERIFDPFFTTKAAGEGTGLGLAVVHGIMFSHGGAITVQSEVGSGTTFTLYFPAVAAREEAAPVQKNRFPRGAGQRVLVIDDEDSVATSLSRMLERLGYQVSRYTRPLEALEAFRRVPNQFDLILTDLTMPQLDGVSLAKEIHDLAPDLPVLLMTGYSGKTADLNLSDVGIFQVLAKPVSLQTLADAASQAILGPVHT